MSLLDLRVAPTWTVALVSAMAIGARDALYVGGLEGRPAVDARLIPVNAFIALVSSRATSWPNPLYEVGYRLEGLEVPAKSADGKVVVDCVAFDASTNRFMLAEAKSGNNIEVEQAQRYGDVDASNLIRLIGVTITEPGEQFVESVYVCLADGLDRILRGLEAAECAYPVIAVDHNAVSLHGAAPANPAVAEAFSEPIPVPGPPPAVVVVDDQSPAHEFDGLVAAAVVAEIAHGSEMIPCPELASRAIPHLHIFGAGHRGRLVRAVTDAAQRFCEAASDNFEFRPPTQSRDYAVVKVLDSPERSDPRGRTQRYQALKARLTGVPVTPVHQNQGSLFDDADLAAELEKADTGDADAGASIEEDQ